MQKSNPPTGGQNENLKLKIYYLSLHVLRFTLHVPLFRKEA
ncbi:MAG: hypothetical protein KatS3mg092_0886 [Patescibacteria group bacterium]|nr:MAG: hypothetical protein KatS3mg092_0886 [Patescibacteria group bacterium]